MNTPVTKQVAMLPLPAQLLTACRSAELLLKRKRLTQLREEMNKMQQEINGLVDVPADLVLEESFEG